MHRRNRRSPPGSRMSSTKFNYPLESGGLRRFLQCIVHNFVPFAAFCEILSW